MHNILLISSLFAIVFLIFIGIGLAYELNSKIRNYSTTQEIFNSIIKYYIVVLLLILLSYVFFNSLFELL